MTNWYELNANELIERQIANCTNEVSPQCTVVADKGEDEEDEEQEARHTCSQREIVESMLKTCRLARTRTTHENETLIASRFNQTPVGGLCQRVDVGRHILGFAAAEHGNNLRIETDNETAR